MVLCSLFSVTFHLMCVYIIILSSVWIVEYPQFGHELLTQLTDHMSSVMRKPTVWFPTWSDTNQAVQLENG